MNRMTTLLAVATLAAVPLMQGCGSDAQVIEQDRSITSIDQIDIQDFRAAASTLTRQMLNDPRYASEVQRLKSQTPGGGAPIMKVSKIKNDTMLKVDMRGFLVDPMEAELAKSRTVDFFAEDAEAQSLAKMNEMRSGQGPRLPDLVLYGTVRELTAEAGRTKQVSYIFHLKLANASGITIWQDDKLITKQGTHNAVGM